MTKRKGFTLAEVLVTLAVIGVIAALAIPTLLQNINNAQYKTAWKKAFASLEQATRMAYLDAGSSFNGTFSATSDILDAYKAQMNVTKECTSAAGNCWHADGDWEELDAGTPTATTTGAGMITNDGMLMFFDSASSTCAGAKGTIDICGEIFVDVNGFKKPNVIGKDIYNAYILDGYLKPAGAEGDAITSSDCTANGYGCSVAFINNET